MVSHMATSRDLLLAEQERTQARIQALEREFADIAEAASSAGTDDEHDPEGATLAFERQHTAALLDQAREQLAAIEAALRKLQDGSYGTCQRCGQPIGPARLAARPSATTCLPCAQPRSRRG
jgi:RNA polymerase-binding protein DksA